MRINFLFLITMFLTQALRNIKNYEQNSDRQQVLAQTLKNPEKLAKTHLRIEFLTACRRNNVSPRFIEDALRPMNNIFRDNHSVQSRCKRLSNSLLNEAISETHRTKAYLIRQRDRFASTIADFLDQGRLSYIHATCERIFEATIHENRPRLLSKFRSRTKETAGIHPDEGETAVTKQKKINNLSSIQLDDASLRLLSKGPNFALTQKISKDVLLEAEKGVERLAYAKRWRDAIARSRQPTLVPAGDRDATTDDRPPEPASEHAGRIHAGPSALAAPPPRAAGDGGTAAGTETPRAGTSEDRGPATSAPATGVAGIDTGGASEATTPAQRASSQTGLSFRFADTDKRFPPPSTINVELKLKRLKEDIVKTYKSHNIVNSNVSNDDRQFLRTLQKNDDVVIKQSDKCKGFVIMDKSTYLDKAQEILGDPTNYEKFAKNPVSKIAAETKRIFNSVSKDKLTEKIIKELTPNHSRTPVFYGLPKDHKPAVPLRPVISGCDGPTKKDVMPPGTYFKTTSKVCTNQLVEHSGFF